MDEHESIIDNGSCGNQFVALVVETRGDRHFEILNHLFLNSGLQMTYFNKLAVLKETITLFFFSVKRHVSQSDRLSFPASWGQVSQAKEKGEEKPFSLK